LTWNQLYSLVLNNFGAQTLPYRFLSRSPTLPGLSLPGGMCMYVVPFGWEQRKAESTSYISPPGEIFFLIQLVHQYRY
jgi:hypothetical protein